MAGGGAAETAAWAVVLNVSAIVFMIPMGLSSATAVLVGRSYGAGDGRGVLRAGLVGLGVVTAMTFVVALLVWPSAHLIVGAYNRDPALLAIAAPALVIVLPSMLFLLPGLMMFRSVYGFTVETGSTLLGVAGLFNAAVIVVAIAAGVAFGNTLAKPITDRMGTLLPTELVMHQRG